MLKIEKLDYAGNILREDLTGIQSDPAKIKAYHSEIQALCKKERGVGVAANQVGLRENFFFLAAEAKVPTKSGKPASHLCINPSWEPAHAADLVQSVEGCLSIPRKNLVERRRFVVPRYNVIEAEWTNTVGHRVKMRLKGLAAIVFQHESDHLRGVTLVESGQELK